MLAEARASARVTSSHAVDIFDLVEEQDALWLVMELVPRPSLARMVSEEGPLDDAGAARVGLAVLDVLEAARADGIVHGDLTPANVLVGEPAAADTGVRVKLADLRAATRHDEVVAGATEPSPGADAGPPETSAPASSGEGPNSNMHALGALLHFAVAGRPPGDDTSDRGLRGDERDGAASSALAPVISRLLDGSAADGLDTAQVRALLAPVARTGHQDGELYSGIATGAVPGPGASEGDLTVASGPWPGGAVGIGARPVGARRGRAVAVPGVSVLSSLVRRHGSGLRAGLTTVVAVVAAAALLSAATTGGAGKTMSNPGDDDRRPDSELVAITPSAASAEGTAAGTAPVGPATPVDVAVEPVGEAPPSTPADEAEPPPSTSSSSVPETSTTASTSTTTPTETTPPSSEPADPEPPPSTGPPSSSPGGPPDDGDPGDGDPGGGGGNDGGGDGEPGDASGGAEAVPAA